MRTERIIDARGLVTLVTIVVAAAVYGFAIPAVISGTSPRRSLPLDVTIGLASAVTMGGLLLWSWHHEGGRRSIAETNEWIRAFHDFWDTRTPRSEVFGLFADASGGADRGSA